MQKCTIGWQQQCVRSTVSTHCALHSAVLRSWNAAFVATQHWHSKQQPTEHRVHHDKTSTFVQVQSMCPQRSGSSFDVVQGALQSASVGVCASNQEVHWSVHGASEGQGGCHCHVSRCGRELAACSQAASCRPWGTKRLAFITMLLLAVERIAILILLSLYCLVRHTLTLHCMQPHCMTSVYCTVQWANAKSDQILHKRAAYTWHAGSQWTPCWLVQPSIFLSAYDCRICELMCWAELSLMLFCVSAELWCVYWWEQKQAAHRQAWRNTNRWLTCESTGHPYRWGAVYSTTDFGSHQSTVALPWWMLQVPVLCGEMFCYIALVVLVVLLWVGLLKCLLGS